MKNYSIQKLDDETIHRWYRFVLSYPDHFVRDVIESENLNKNSVILDPFLGTGTTTVEARKQGYFSIGIEANPVCYFASKVKCNWNLNIDVLKNLLAKINNEYKIRLEQYDLGQITKFVKSSKNHRLLKPFHVNHKLLNDKYISPIPWTKISILKNIINQFIKQKEYLNLFLLTLAKTFRSVANVKFGPEIGYIKPRLDAKVIATFSNYVKEIIEDIRVIKKENLINSPVPLIKLGDSRKIHTILEDYENNIDLVITSPPYPVDKDYTRITRLEMVILDMAETIIDVRKIKKKMIRSSTRQIYKEDNEKEKIKDIPEVFNISNEIRSRVKRDGDTSGFSKVYPRLVEEYFGGMHSHFESLYPVLKSKGKCYYLIGNSRSFKMVHIETAKICGIIAEKVGYKVESIEVFRDRNSTAHNSDLLENILILKK